MDLVETPDRELRALEPAFSVSKAPRVLLCDSLPFWGGGEHWIVQIGSALSSRGWEVTVAGRCQSELLQRAGQVGLPTVAWAYNRDFDLATIRASSSWMELYNPDVVMVTTARDIRTVGLAARRHRIPVVWRVGPKPKDNFVHRLTGRFVVSLVITPSHYVADELAPFPWLTKKIRVIHNGVTIIERPTPEQVHDARRKIGISDDRQIVLYVGRLMTGKGVDTLIRAFANVHAQNSKTALLMVGAGPDESLCRNLTRELGIESVVEFRGYTPDPASYFDACDLFVLPSRYESFSYVLLEAMVRGKPCIATRAGAIPEVTGEKAALLVPPDDPSALGAAINSLLQDRLRRELLAAQGRAHALKNYPLDDCVDAVEALFREAAQIPMRA